LESLSRSIFHRIRESEQGRTERFKPDYPLVLFILFSRISVGFGYSASFLYVSKSHLSFYLTVCAFIAMVTAMILSLTHLAIPFRFYRVLRNPFSNLTLEIYLSSVYLGVLFILILNEVTNSSEFYNTSAVLIAISASLFLLGTTYAYRYTSHPLWNTMRLFPYYLLNGVAFASFILGLTSLIYGGRTSSAYMICGALFILLQSFSASYYIIFLKEKSTSALVYIKKNKSSLAYSWLISNFLFPISISCVFLIMGSSGFLSIFGMLILLVSMVFGVYMERFLFFFLEKPVFFFNPELQGRVEEANYLKQEDESPHF